MTTFFSSLYRLVRVWSLPLLFGAGVRYAVGATPVEFTFEPPPSEQPWAREIWGEVILPSGRSVRVPAFFRGEGKYSVRVRANETGEYRLAKTVEGALAESGSELRVPLVPPQHVGKKEERRAIRISASDSARFEYEDGAIYFPLGTNLAWATESDRAAWYEQKFHEFSAVKLNWTRVWMAHWGGLNLDWSSEKNAKPLPRGQLDGNVAATWDAIIAAADDAGVYLQFVLQHHGQYSTKVNPNWKENPWNAANPGGFLRTPAEFFTSEEAAKLTRQKYRYVVARWGYSPAILAWELFNEVHWVDALRMDHNETAVARWHREMATYLRSVDAYHHLVTTSTDNLSSRIYEGMDYLQPHLYATNMLAAVRRFDIDPSQERRPLFYGEIGNDNMRLSDAQKASGVDQVPLAWASLMGTGRYAGQIWEGEKVVAQGRLGELAALAKFVEETNWAGREGLKPFSAVLTTTPKVPLVIEPGDNWHARRVTEVSVPMDGRQTLEFGEIPRFLVNAKSAERDGFPDQIVLKLTTKKSTTMRAQLSAGATASAGARVLVDDQLIATPASAAVTQAGADKSSPRWEMLEFAVGAGSHRISIEHTSKGEWFEFGSLDTGVETSVLSSLGKRSANFIALWVFHRRGIFSVADVAPAQGEVVVEDVASGQWRIDWIDSVTGRKLSSSVVDHAGGSLVLETPAVSRHAVVTLTRERPTGL